MNLDVMNGFIFVPSEISETGNPCLDRQLADAERRSELFATYNVTFPDLSPDELDRYKKYISVSNELDTLDEHDVICIVRGEIYAPFIWLFTVLGIVFLLCGFFQKTQYQEDYLDVLQAERADRLAKSKMKENKRKMKN